MLKERDKVYLLRKNIKTIRSSRKLDHVKIRPFKIVRNIKGTSFKLKLSKGIKKKHLVFYISLLELASEEVSELTQVPENYLIKQEGQYEVESILQDKDIEGQQYYCVK